MLKIQCVNPKEIEDIVRNAEGLSLGHTTDSCLLKCNRGSRESKVSVKCSIRKEPNDIFVVSVTEHKDGKEHNIYVVTAGDIDQLRAQIKWIVSRSVRVLINGWTTKSRKEG